MKRRDFNHIVALGTLGLAFSGPQISRKKISLAQWSLHRAIKINTNNIKRLFIKIIKTIPLLIICI